MTRPLILRTMRITLLALGLIALVWLLATRAAPAQASGVVGTGTPQSCTSDALAQIIR